MLLTDVTRGFMALEVVFFFFLQTHRCVLFICAKTSTSTVYTAGVTPNGATSCGYEHFADCKARGEVSGFVLARRGLEDKSSASALLYSFLYHGQLPRGGPLSPRLLCLKWHSPSVQCWSCWRKMGHGLTHFSSACTKTPQSDLRQVKCAAAKGLTHWRPGGQRGQGNICVKGDNKTAKLLLEGKTQYCCGCHMNVYDPIWTASTHT